VNFTIEIDEHVRRLQVSMENAVLMRIMDRLGHGLDMLHGALRWQRLLAHAATRGPGLPHTPSKVMLAVFLADLVNADDVRVVQIAGGFRLCAEAAHELGIVEPRMKNHLHRHDAVERKLARLVNHAHAAARDFLDQLVIAKAAARLGAAQQ
jgi:hypothetical protein